MSFEAQITPQPRSPGERETSAALSAYKRKRQLLAAATLAAAGPSDEAPKQYGRPSRSPSAREPSQSPLRGRSQSRGRPAKTTGGAAGRAKPALEAESKRGAAQTRPQRSSVSEKAKESSDRAWRLGRPGGGSSATSARAALVQRPRRTPWTEARGRGDSPPADAGGSQRREPFVQVFVSPGRAILAPASRADDARATSAGVPALPPPSAATHVSAATASVATSIDSARALMSDISRLLGRAPVVASPSPVAAVLSYELPAGSSTNEAGPVHEEASVHVGVGSRAVASTSAFIDPIAEATRVRLGIRLHQLVGTVCSLTCAHVCKWEGLVFLHARARMRVQVRSYDRELLRLVPPEVASAVELSAPFFSDDVGAAASLLPPALELVLAATVSPSAQLGISTRSTNPAAFADLTVQALRKHLMPGQTGTLAYLWANRKDALAELRLIERELGQAHAVPGQFSSASDLGFVSTRGVSPAALRPPLVSGSGPANPAMLQGPAEQRAPLFSSHSPAAVKSFRSRSDVAAIASVAGQELAALLDRAESPSPNELQALNQQGEPPQVEQTRAMYDQAVRDEGQQQQLLLRPLEEQQLWPQQKQHNGVNDFGQGRQGSPSPPSYLRQGHSPLHPATTSFRHDGARDDGARDATIGLAVSDLQSQAGDFAAASWLPLQPPRAASPPRPATTTLVLSAAASVPVARRPLSQPSANSQWLGDGVAQETVPHRPVRVLARPSAGTQQQWGVSDRAQTSIYVRAARAAAKNHLQTQSARSGRTTPAQAAAHSTRGFSSEHVGNAARLEQQEPQQAPEPALEVPAAHPRSTRLAVPPQPPPQSPSPPRKQLYAIVPQRLGDASRSPPRQQFRASGTRGLLPLPHTSGRLHSSLHEPLSATTGHEQDRARPPRPHACADEGIHVEELPPPEAADAESTVLLHWQKLLQPTGPTAAPLARVAASSAAASGIVPGPASRASGRAPLGSVIASAGGSGSSASGMTLSQLAAL